MKRNKEPVTSAQHLPPGSKPEVVDQAEYNIYDSLAEALATEGEEKVLKLVNVQVKTNALNEARARATSKPTKQWFRDQAMASITPEEFMAAQGDPAKMKNLVDAKAEAAEVAYETDRKAKIAAMAKESEGQTATPAA